MDWLNYHHLLYFWTVVREGGIGMCMADAIRQIEPHRSVTVLGIPSKFIPQGNADKILAAFGLDAAGITATVRAAVGR